MTDATIRRLLETLRDRRGNSAEFRAEIDGYLEDLGEDALDQHDVSYIRRLADRLGVEAAGAEAGADSAPAEAVAEAVAEAEPGEDRFDQAKAAFARLFDPANLDPDAPDTALRTEIFEEFWAELERIEDDG
ncbi:MAG: hypothetical protein IH906_02710 [Proteobacteria bacterium]|nr:hypothetical protein [Pseudomonadota bacterium]